MRKYPVGIQTFERIIKEGFVYVDKTDLVWQLAHYANVWKLILLPDNQSFATQEKIIPYVANDLFL